MHYIQQAWASLLEQGYTDWEWVIVPNAGAIVPENIASSDKVVVVQGEDDQDGKNKVGRLKFFACLNCCGDILVELDADDLLAPNALQKINETFQDPNVHFAYSNDSEFFDKTWEPHTYSSVYGWHTRPFEYKGHSLFQNVAWEPSPHMLRLVYWAPDHIRAWRTESYWQVGGHNPNLLAGDDHELCCRTYLTYGAPGMKHIDECLYLYRKHQTSTCAYDYFQFIQGQSGRNYKDYIFPMAMRWAKDNGLATLDLGGALNPMPGMTVVDSRRNGGVIANLDSDWPFADNSVGVIRASHVFEHLVDNIHSMNEAYRVLAPGGFLFMEVPSAKGNGMWRDPSHKSPWILEQFWYYTQARYAQYIQPEYKGRFQILSLRESSWDDGALVVQADLAALKPPYSDRPAGEVLI